MTIHRKHLAYTVPDKVRPQAVQGLFLWSAMPREEALGPFSAGLSFLFPVPGTSGSFPPLPLPSHSSMTGKLMFQDSSLQTGTPVSIAKPGPQSTSSHS